MSLIIGDTPEQLEQGLLINGELWTAKRIAELQAQVEQLKVALAATRQPYMDYIPTLDKTAQQVLDETPAQSLAELRVQDRKNGFTAGYFYCRNYGFQFENELEEASYQYANKIT